MKISFSCFYSSSNIAKGIPLYSFYFLIIIVKWNEKKDVLRVKKILYRSATGDNAESKVLFSVFKETHPLDRDPFFSKGSYHAGSKGIFPYKMRYTFDPCRRTYAFLFFCFYFSAIKAQTEWSNTDCFISKNWAAI